MPKLIKQWQKMFKKVLGIMFVLCLLSIQQTYSKEKKVKNDLYVLDVINYNWWLDFNDTNLTRYIIEGLKNNNDIKIAKLRLEEYNQFVKYSFGAELPSISTSLDGFALNSSPIPSFIMKKNGLILPIILNYEVDIFGKNRNKTQSAKKQLEAYEYQMQSIYLSLVSNISTIYFNIMQVNKLIELNNELLNIKNSILDNLNQKYKKGIISDLELNRVKQDIQNVNIRIDNLKKSRVELLTQLCVMIGEDPNRYNELKISNIDDLNRNDFVFIISSDSIFSRPDVLLYEKQLEKSGIDIKIARKEFFPTINLNGGVFFTNIVGGGLFSPANTIASILGGITGDLFTGGRKKANLDIMKSRYRQSFEEYIKVNLQSVKEVNDSLYTLKTNNTILQRNLDKFKLEEKNYKHYKEMFKNGIIAESDLKKAEQNLVAVKMELISAKIQMYIGYITLYKAVGGKL